MKRLVTTLATLLLAIATTTPAGASRSECATLAGPLSAAAAQFATLYSALDGMDVTAAADKFDGPEREAMDTFEATRQKTLPDLKALLRTLQALAYRMQECSL